MKIFWLNNNTLENLYTSNKSNDVLNEVGTYLSNDELLNLIKEE